MKSAFNKEIVRSITQSVGRFAAIAIISLLGAGVYAGLRMAAPDMRISGDEFFDGAALYDVSVMTTLGLDDDSLAMIRNVEGVGGVMAVHRSDAMALVGDGSYTAAVESSPVDSARESDTTDGVHAFSDDSNYLNRLILEEGSWPSSGTECVVGVDAAREHGISPGSTIVLSEDTSAGSTEATGSDDNDDDDDEPTFAHDELVVAGLVNSPAYGSSSMLGTTKLGTGELELYIYVPDEVFNQELPYSMAYLSVPGALAEQWDSPAYDEAVAPVKANLEKLAPDLANKRYQAVVAKAQKELDDAREEYLEKRADAEAELADARDELEDAQNDLSEAKDKLDDGKSDVEKGRKELVSAHKKLKDAYDTLEASRKKLDASRKQLDESYAQLNQTYEQIKQMEAGIQSGAITDPQTIAQYEYISSEYQKGLAQYEAGLAAYTQGLSQYEEGLAQYEKGKADYEKGVAKYNSGLSDYNDGVAEYEDGIAKYENGVAEYEDGVAEANKEFADAEKELADAQKKIDDIEYPDVYVMDRSKNTGAAALSSDAEGIDQIALFIPYMFFLVAALVSLTSMTRMVDEERLNIGTHKALGYGKARITSKYLIYGSLASGLGSAVGAIALGKLLPWFILVSYGISYAIPVYAIPIDAGIVARAVGFSVGITLVATWGAAASTLRARPAALMLPRAPKAGKRIVLERIKPLWSRLSFSHKVTARNLLRYKRRFFMAVVGVAGCTALLMIGFGLRDAIGGIVNNQYTVLTSYDAVVRVDDEITEDQRAAVVREFGGDGVESYLDVADFNLIAEGETDDMRIEVVVPSDAGRLADFVTLRNRETSDPLSLEDGRIVLTEKAADVLGVSTGDTVTLYDEDDVGDKTGSGRSFVVGGITENYLGHFAYLLPEVYRSAYGEEPTYDLSYLKLSDTSESATKELSNRLLAFEGVNTVSFVSDKISTYEGMLDVMNKLIYVVMLLSAALAFVVLYNLTNINITERVREIATLKVLGFTRREVSTYIFREIMVMALIGALAGCVLGVPLTFYIARAAETANMMFGRTIEPLSFVLSFVLTMVFAAIVAFSMRGKLRRVNMVESLKSIE